MQHRGKRYQPLAGTTKKEKYMQFIKPDIDLNFIGVPDYMIIRNHIIGIPVFLNNNTFNNYIFEVFFVCINKINSFLLL